MASEWFDKVTGSNDYERQSWRDNYNGGRAAGDWTGNNNARIDAERASHDGGTHSGSSFQDQYSREEMNLGMKYGISLPALVQMARDPGPGVQVSYQTASTGPGVASATTGNPGTAIMGPGSAGVASGATSGVGGGGAATRKPRGGTATFQIPMDSPTAIMPIYSGGKPRPVDRGYSNVEDIETRLGDVEFMSPSFFEAWKVNWADYKFGVVNGPVPEQPTAAGGDIIPLPDAFESMRRVGKNWDSFVSGIPERVNGPMPKQEAVDWGR